MGNVSVGKPKHLLQGAFFQILFSLLTSKACLGQQWVLSIICIFVLCFSANSYAGNREIFDNINKKLDTYTQSYFDKFWMVSDALKPDQTPLQNLDKDLQIIVLTLRLIESIYLRSIEDLTILSKFYYNDLSLYRSNICYRVKSNIRCSSLNRIIVYQNVLRNLKKSTRSPKYIEAINKSIDLTNLIVSNFKELNVTLNDLNCDSLSMDKTIGEIEKP